MGLKQRQVVRRRVAGGQVHDGRKGALLAVVVGCLREHHAGQRRDLQLARVLSRNHENLALDGVQAVQQAGEHVDDLHVGIGA